MNGSRVKEYHRRGLAALATGALMAAGIALPSAAAQAASAPTEVKTIPGDDYLDYATDLPVFAGVTGFLHQRAVGTPWLWTRYSDRHTTVVSALAGQSTGSIVGAGGDTVYFNVTSARRTLDLSTMTVRTLPALPGNPGSARVFGDSVLTLRSSSTGYEVGLYRLDDDSITPTPITGLPESIHSVLVMAGDATSAVLRLVTPAGVEFVLLDVTSGESKQLPPSGSPVRALLTKDRIALVDTTTISVYSRSGVANGADPEADRFAFPAGARTDAIGLAGRDLIVGPADDVRPFRPARRYHPDGTAPTDLVPQANWRQAQSPDGVLFVGGSGVADWSVRKATATGQSAVLPLSTQVNAGVTLSSGVLRHIQAPLRPGETSSVYTHFPVEFAPDSTGNAPKLHTGRLIDPRPCEAGAVCVRTVDGSAGGTSYLGTSASSLFGLMTFDGWGAMFQALPSTAGTVVDASASYQIVNGTNPDQQYILEYGRSKPIVTRPVTGAALWLNTLWSVTRAGYVQPKDLFSGKVGAEVATGSACAATEVQATANQIYWSCGRSGPSGVITKNKNIALPAGQYLLGDNYIVRHDKDGALLRYDLTGATLGEPVALATFPRGTLTDDRDITWAVDKFGGDVAWVDSDNTTHIVDPGVAPSPLSSLPDRDYEYIDEFSRSLSVTVPLARPVNGTTFAVKDMRTGTVVTSSGGPTRTKATGAWDGRVGGKPATQGAYQWSLSATADGSTTRLTGGVVWVGCPGTQPLHSYNCSGRPHLLGLTSAATGAGQWLAVNPGGAGLTRYDWYAESLTPVTAVVPFGDITKDGRNDLLIRRSNGSLLSFRGDSDVPFTGNPLVAVPGNWNRWDVLVHTGDLTGDGQSDLIARDRATGGLYRIDGDGRGSFKPPVLWANGYKGYTRFVGPGDINGDGKADLLLFVGTDMYAKYGDGKGGLGDRRLVGSGFLGYNAIVGAGDLNEDGNNDLLLRDTAGNLYRRLGDGKGDFGNRLLVGVGYQKYASIY